MNLDNVRSITFVKQHAAEILRQVEETRQPVVVTQQGEARAVIVDVATYGSWQDSLALLKILAHAEEDVARQRTAPQAEAFARARRALAAEAGDA